MSAHLGCAQELGLRLGGAGTSSPPCRGRAMAARARASWRGNCKGQIRGEQCLALRALSNARCLVDFKTCHIGSSLECETGRERKKETKRNATSEEEGERSSELSPVLSCFGRFTMMAARHQPDGLTHLKSESLPLGCYG